MYQNVVWMKRERSTK